MKKSLLQGANTAKTSSLSVRSYIKRLSTVNALMENAEDKSILLNASEFPSAPNSDDINRLTEFVSQSRYLVAITGAGISTASGIPDYRGPKGSYRLGHKPMVHNEFVTSEEARKRYWTRSMMGWNRFSQAKPNDAHIALAQLESFGTLKQIVTQNVDRLHQRAGANKVVDLHGRIDRVRCLSCQALYSRRMLQQSLLNMNEDFIKKHNLHPHSQHDEVEDEGMRADGDAELTIKNYSEFKVPTCMSCGGVLKPDVTFFGDNVPTPLVQNIYEQIDNCDRVLVVGTSLEVYSAYRFIDRANKKNIPIAIINFGETRAERQRLHTIEYKSETNCAILLKEVVRQLV